MHRKWKLVGSAIASVAVVGSVGLTPAPAQAEPDIDKVRDRVDSLYQQAEVASERYNDAKIKLERLRKEVKGLRSDEKKQKKQVSKARTSVEQSLVRQYQGESLDAASQVVVSEDPSSFLSGLSTMSSFNDLQSQNFTSYSTEYDALKLRSGATGKRLQELATVEADLKKQKAEINRKHNKAQKVLDGLEADEREQVTQPADNGSGSEDSETPKAAPAPSGNASAAISYAMAQVGDAYVYGAAGPDAFDCSGLTMMAWAQAGVSLPHSSSAQMSSGSSVSMSALQPGDLVFYYSPVSHVGMYIGNGNIVHAANPGSGVVTAPVGSMPVAGAVRPG